MQRIVGRTSLGAIFASLACLLLAAPAFGAGQHYWLNQCDGVHGNNPYIAGAGRVGSFDTGSNCTNGGTDLALHVNAHSGQVNSGHTAYWYWHAPAGEYIDKVAIQGSLNYNNGYHPEIYTVGVSGGNYKIAGDNGGAWTNYSTTVPPASELRVQLRCGASTCTDDPNSGAHAFARAVNIRLVDTADPAVQSTGGSLLGGGWVRGVRSLGAQGGDGQSGAAAIAMSANGNQIAANAGACQVWPSGSAAGRATQFDPCPRSVSLNGEANTAAGPFRDGDNNVVVCVADFAGNAGCQTSTVHVDNTPPHVAFADSRSPRDPERIVAPATDATSGVAGGTIYLRAMGGSAWQPLSTKLKNSGLVANVNSEAYPPGEYEFEVVASDKAGNEAGTTTRADGGAMTLAFPLKTHTRIRAHFRPGASKRLRVSYGRAGRLSGRLVRANRKPLRSRRVLITENFAPGSVVAHRQFKVKTNKHGRFQAKLPPGPSRGVVASFEGNARYVGSLGRVGRMVVRSKATFSTSKARVPAGERVNFHGRVLHFGARVPPAGKLVELQVKQGAHEWNTVQQAIHTSSGGRYHLHYRFGTFYKDNVRYRFRVKIDREQDWPYQAPVRSRARSVTVLAHH